MQILILLLLFPVLGYERDPLSAVPEGATREIWESTDRFEKSKNRASSLLDIAREKYSGTDKML